MFNLDIEDVFGKAWERWKSALGDVILFSLGYLIGIFVFSLLVIFLALAFIIPIVVLSSGVRFEEIKTFRELLAGFGGILPILIVGIIFFAVLVGLVTLAWEAGWRIAMMKVLLMQKLTLGDLFSQFPKMLHLFLASVLIGLIVALGIIIFLIPGIVLAILFSQTMYLIIQRDKDFISAMSESWNRVARDFWQVTGILVLLNIGQLGIELMASVVDIVTFIPLGSLAVVLLVRPYFIIARWVLYFALFPREEPAPAVERVESYAIPPIEESSEPGAFTEPQKEKTVDENDLSSGREKIGTEGTQVDLQSGIATEERDVSINAEPTKEGTEDNSNLPK